MKTSVVVPVFLILSFPQIHGKLTRTPSDNVASLGSTVTLECFTENKQYPPTWSHKPDGSTDFEDVYLVLPGTSGGIIGRTTADYYERFKVVENRETGDYSLQIRSVEIKDAGVYACTARGGLGQQATASLTINGYVKSLVCKANTTQVLDHSFCHHEPDYISVSCRFELLGQTLPSVTWVRTDRPEVHRKIEVAHWTVETGIAESTYLIRDNEEGLDGASFTCLVSDVNCTTSAFKVHGKHNVVRAITVNSPEEVECNFSLPHQTGCKWVRRKAEKHEPDDEVSKNPILNLYRPDMTYGKYVCIVECDIGTKSCSMEALTVAYQPLKTDSETDSTSIDPVVVVVVVVVVIVVCALIGAVILFVIYKRRQQRANKDQKANGQADPMMPNGTQPDSVPRQNGTIGSKEVRHRRIEETARQNMNANAAKNLTNGPNIDEGLRLRTG